MNKGFSWETLIKISDLSLSKVGLSAAIAVPFMATVISAYNAHFGKFGFHMSIGTQSLVVYFSGLLFYVSSVLTKLFCDQLVREHKTLVQYVSATIKSYNMLSETFDKNVQLVSQNEIEMILRDASGGEFDGADYLVLKGVGKRLITNAGEDWKSASQKNPFTRTIISCLFLLSFVGSAYVLLWYTPIGVIGASIHN